MNLVDAAPDARVAVAPYREIMHEFRSGRQPNAAHLYMLIDRGTDINALPEPPEKSKGLPLLTQRVNKNVFVPKIYETTYEFAIKSRGETIWANVTGKGREAEKPDTEKWLTKGEAEAVLKQRKEGEPALVINKAYFIKESVSRIASSTVPNPTHEGQISKDGFVITESSLQARYAIRDDSNQPLPNAPKDMIQVNQKERKMRSISELRQSAGQLLAPFQGAINNIDDKKLDNRDLRSQPYYVVVSQKEGAIDQTHAKIKTPEQVTQHPLYRGLLKAVRRVSALKFSGHRLQQTY